MTRPVTVGFASMAVTVLVDTAADIERVIGWVQQFEQIGAIGSWHGGQILGEVSFHATSIEQYQRLVGYVASWEGETTATVAACTECCVDA